MPRQIWNEGRVVGFSAYEVYLKHALSIDPNHEPATEKEWLASMMAMGSSMLLRIGTTSETYIDVPFPADSRLCAANNILASVFTGEGYVGNAATSEHVWCTKVTDYGPLIANSSSRSPSTVGVQTAENIRTKDENISLSDIEKSSIREYMKIVDGIIIQPGTWVTNSNKPPQKDFTPELAQVPTLRIAFSEPVTEPFFILLTGFTNRSVVTGVTGFFDPQRPPIDVGYDSAVNTQSPQDGDFLGPWAFPWAAKIIFSVPSAYISYFMNNKYTRELPEGSEAVTVKSDAIIDMKQSAPGDGYPSSWQDTSISAYVTDINLSGEDAAVLATYMHTHNNTSIPPALYGAVVGGDGAVKFYPVDTVAPGAAKIYDGDITSVAANSPIAHVRALESQAPHTVGLLRGTEMNDDESSGDYVLYQRDKDADTVIPVSKVSKTNLLGVLSVQELLNPLFFVEGSYAREGVETYTQDGTKISSVEAIKLNGSEWYAIIDDSIRDEYADVDETGRVEGTVIVADPLQYTGVRCMIWKRITGKLSDTIYEQCGYDLTDANGNLNPIFEDGGIWSEAYRNMCDQVDDPKNYYVIIPGGWPSNNPVWPVRKSDHILDVSIRYGFNIVVNGTNWNIPAFVNDNSKANNSKYLGSWWGSSGLSADKKTSSKYDSKWAYIYIDGVSHPTALSKLPPNSTGQVYFDTAMLPVDGLYSRRMSAVFTTSKLRAAGIASKYWNYTIERFLQVALYTDMGTGRPLPATHENILQSQHIYTNGYDSTSNTNVGENIVHAFDLTVSNNAATTGKTQIMPIPETYLEISPEDPVGLLTQTGRLQGLSLSMADIDNTPYSIYGTSGKLSIPDSGLSWYYMLIALSTDRVIDVLGPILINLRKHITGSGPDHLEFANGLRLYISNTKPTDTDIPDGSIGIGWEEE